MDQEVAQAARLDAVVTVADARWLSERLKDAPEAKNQIAFADVILLNKTDLVNSAELNEVEGRIRGLNPYAKVHKTQRCNIALDEVLGRNAFDLQRILDLDPDFLEVDEHDHHDHHAHQHDHSEACGPDCGNSHHHHDRADEHKHHHQHGVAAIHDDEVKSVAFEIAGDVDPDKFMPWVHEVVQKDGLSILRSKGILSFRNEPKRFVFQGVHMLLDGDLQRDWKSDEVRKSKIVFIGRNLKTDELRQGFLACAA